MANNQTTLLNLTNKSEIEFLRYSSTVINDFGNQLNQIQSQVQNLANIFNEDLSRSMDNEFEQCFEAMKSIQALIKSINKEKHVLLFIFLIPHTLASAKELIRMSIYDANENRPLSEYYKDNDDYMYNEIQKLNNIAESITAEFYEKTGNIDLHTKILNNAYDKSDDISPESTESQPPQQQEEENHVDLFLRFAGDDELNVDAINISNWLLNKE